MLSEYAVLGKHIGIKPSLYDNVMYVGALLMYIVIHRIVFPPQVTFLIGLLGNVGYLVIGMIAFMFVPIITYAIGKYYWRKKKVEKKIFLSNCSLGLLTWLFIITFPTDLVQGILYIQ